MPRASQLRKKNGFWYTATGPGRYFGSIADVPFEVAKRRFADFLKEVSLTRSSLTRGVITVTFLVEEFLDWVQANRSERTYDERKRHLERFCNFRRGSIRIAELPATDVQAADLEKFISFVKEEYGNDDFTADKHATSVKAAFNWGMNHPAPTPYLAGNFRPFSTIEKYRRPLEPLTESDLITETEFAALLRHADDDLGQIRENGGTIRSRKPEQFRTGDANPYRGFGDLLRCYYNTGARTSELADWRVRDFLRSQRVVVLGKEKRSRTMKFATSRRIVANDVVNEILLAQCKGKSPNDHIFTDPKGRPWNRDRLDHRFLQVRGRAQVRPEITIYSFRHLWISEAVMAGLDIATVAKMAGTSIAMIEKVYGHFSGDHLREAQSQLDVARRKTKEQKPSDTTAA